MARRESFLRQPNTRVGLVVVRCLCCTAFCASGRTEDAALLNLSEHRRYEEARELAVLEAGR